MIWDCIITTADHLPERSWGWEDYNYLPDEPDEPDYIEEEDEEVSYED